LHLLSGRLQGAKRAAAERGELRTPLPVGFVHDDEGNIVIDPDEEVATAVADVFAAFTATGTAYGVVGAFKDRRFPRRAYGGAWAGKIHFDRLTHSRACSILSNPVYAGAYVFGRRRSRRTVTPDGAVRSSTVELPREDWAVLIQDHHPGYITWDTFLGNEAKLAANRTNAGARPPREGPALCQGIIICASCGRPMSTRYAQRLPYYECATSRADRTATPGCRSVRAATIDDAVTAALMGVLEPEQLALALAAADEVTARRARSLKAADLAVERAHYQAERAERAFSVCEPENRLVARSLESRWESRLSDLATAENERTLQRQAQTPLPPPDVLAAAVADMHALWDAPSTSDKDRKRLLRTLLGDVTLAQSRQSQELRVGLRWKSGASQELIVQRRPAVTEWRRACDETVALARELGPRMNNPDLAAALNAAGHQTGAGRAFDATAACNLRHAYRIGSPNLLTDGELTVRAVATRLGCSISIVQGWLKTGKLVGRRTNSSGHWAIPFDPDTDAACRDLLKNSAHIHPGEHDRQPGEVSIGELAARLNVKPDVVYYWAQRGHIPTRRGSRCRLWIPLTDDLETQCQQRIADSYKHPERITSPNHTPH